MTNEHNVIFHLILAAMVASIAALLVDKHSFYDHLKVQYMTELENEERAENETDSKKINGEATTLGGD